LTTCSTSWQGCSVVQFIAASLEEERRAKRKKRGAKKSANKTRMRTPKSRQK
jgi:hypothetical protein